MTILMNKLLDILLSWERLNFVILIFDEECEQPKKYRSDRR